MNALLFRKTARLLLLFVLGCVLYSCSSQEEEDMYAQQGIVVPALQMEIFDLINAHRLSIGLPELSNIDDAYVKAAEHTNYMIQHGKPSHDNFFDREAYLVDRAGAEVVAENVAYAFSTARGVVNAWLGSDAHRQIIEGDYTHASICAMQGSDGSNFYTHIFIRK